LPRKLLPKVIENYAFRQGEMMGCDPAGLAMAALAVCAAMISDRIKLKMKVHDDWIEEARIWVALIGPPSMKKTPIMRHAARVLLEIDRMLQREYSQVLADYDTLPDEEKKKLARPTCRSLRIEDTTVEAAQQVFQDSPDGLLCLQDELSGWFGAMDKYNGGKGAAKDRGFWMQSYNGGPYVYHRVSRGSGSIDNLSMCLLGGIQPEPMRAVIADAHDDGLIQRTLPVVLRPSTIGKDEPGIKAVEAYDDVIRKLYRLSPPLSDGFAAQLNVVHVLEFSPKAQQLRRTLEQKHLELQSLEGVNRKLAAHIGKYDGLFGRLCILFHCLDNPNKLPPSISVETAERVAKFMHQFLLPHALAFYTDVLGLADDQNNLTAIADYILAHKKESLSIRDVYRDVRPLRSKRVRQDVEPLLDKLEALGWLERIITGRRDQLLFRVNPEVHTRFADRAAAEVERRAEVREAIQETVDQIRSPFVRKGKSQ
jgi:DNA-binding PadR family transcriptional regulator